MSNSPKPSGAKPVAIECATAVRRLWDYLDGRLSPVAHDEVEAHLAMCEKCPSHFMFSERIKRSLAGASSPAISSEDEARLHQRVRGALARVASEPER